MPAIIIATFPSLSRKFLEAVWLGKEISAVQDLKTGKPGWLSPPQRIPQHVEEFAKC